MAQWTPIELPMLVEFVQDFLTRPAPQWAAGRQFITGFISKIADRKDDVTERRRLAVFYSLPLEEQRRLRLYDETVLGHFDISLVLSPVNFAMGTLRQLIGDRVGEIHHNKIQNPLSAQGIDKVPLSGVSAALIAAAKPFLSAQLNQIHALMQPIPQLDITCMDMGEETSEEKSQWVRITSTGFEVATPPSELVKGEEPGNAFPNLLLTTKQKSCWDTNGMQIIESPLDEPLFVDDEPEESADSCASSALRGFCSTYRCS